VKQKIEAKWTEWHGHETKLTLQTTPAAAAASENGKCHRYEPGKMKRKNSSTSNSNQKSTQVTKSHTEIPKPQKTHLYFWEENW